MTPEQKQAHERLMSVLPIRTHMEEIEETAPWSRKLHPRLIAKVMELTAQGHGRRYIADALNISEASVGRCRRIAGECG